MTQHPITPPPELVRQWLREYYGGDLGEVSPEEMHVAWCAAQWGYDQHEKELLDAKPCVLEVDEYGYPLKLGDFYAS
jgi:hypothetical protein